MKKGKKIVLRCVIALLIIGNVFQFAWNYTRMPYMMVLDRETAVAIATAVAAEEFAPFYVPSQGYVDRDIYVGFEKSIMAWVVVAAPQLSPDGIFLIDSGTEVVIRMRDARILNIGYAVPMRLVLFEPFT